MASKAQRQQLYDYFANNLAHIGDFAGTEAFREDYSDNGIVRTPYTAYGSDTLRNLFGDQARVTVRGRQEMASGDSDGAWVDDPSLGYLVSVGGINAVYGADGTLQKTYRDEDSSWMMKAMGIAMPALAGGVLGSAAFAPQLLGGATAASGAAPISASTPSWISGVGSTAGMTASEIAAATSSLGSGMGIGATGSAAITPLGAAPSAIVKPLVGGAASAGGGFLQNLLSGGGKLLNKLGDSSNLAALYNAYTQRQQGGDMQDWAERLYGDRKQFLDRLAQSYEDPSSYLEGPEYQRMADIELDRLMRKDAARGRLGTDVERQKLMQDYALSHLKDYRSGLAGAAGLTGTDGVAELDIAGGANKRGFLNALFSQAARGAQQPAQQPQNFNVIDFLSNILDLGDLFA